MRRLGALWNRALFAPSSGHRMAAFRILLSLYLLGYLGAMSPHVTLLFSDQGVYVPYALPDLAPPPAGAIALFVGMIGATLSLLVGYRANLSAGCLLLLFLHHYFLQLAEKQSSFDRLLAIYLLVLCFADAGQVWGLDARRRPGTIPVVWAERMIALQTILLYLGAGLWKATNPVWQSGEILWFTLQGMFATSLSFALLQLDLPDLAWKLLTWGIVAAELALGVAFLFRRARPAAIVAGCVFHLLNCVVLFVPEFLVSLCAYAVFVEPATLERLGHRFARAAPAASPPAPSAGPRARS